MTAPFRINGPQPPSSLNECQVCRNREEGLAAMKATCVDQCGHPAEFVTTYQDGSRHCLECEAMKWWAVEEKRVCPQCGCHHCDCKPVTEHTLEIDRPEPYVAMCGEKFSNSGDGKEHEAACENCKATEYRSAPARGDLIEVRRLRGGWERARAYVVIEDGAEIFATACNAPSGAGLYGRENWRWPADPDAGFESGSP